MNRHRRPVRSTVVAAAAAVLLTTGCSSEENLVTVSGAVVEEPGSYMYESLCATCHGASAGGASGPALAGHSDEQVVRQVRAPVGDMPMFAPNKITESGIAALVEYVEALEETGDHGDHAHASGVHSKQDHSQILHAVALRSMEHAELELAAHLVAETAELLVGTHRAAMEDLVSTIDSGDVESAVQTLRDMQAEGSITTGRDAVSLFSELARDELTREELGAARHWVDHAHEFDPSAVADLRAAFEAGDFDAALSLLGADEHADDDHHDDDEVVDDHHDDGEVVVDDHHDDDEVVDDHHDDDEVVDDHHDDGEVVDDHHDDGEVVDDHHDDGEVVDDHHHDDEEVDPAPPVENQPAEDHEHAEDSEPHDH